jgi:hypothetical protein
MVDYYKKYLKYKLKYTNLLKQIGEGKNGGKNKGKNEDKNEDKSQPVNTEDDCIVINGICVGNSQKQESKRYYSMEEC